MNKRQRKKAAKMQRELAAWYDELLSSLQDYEHMEIPNPFVNAITGQPMAPRTDAELHALGYRFDWLHDPPLY